MKIQLTDIGVKCCESECLLASGLETFPTGGGITDMEINHAALEWVADYIWSFGNNATVLEPLELIKLMQKKYLSYEILKLIYADYMTIRRHLIMYGFIERTRDGRQTGK